MDLDIHDLVTLGGILRFALRFDECTRADRSIALADAAHELGLRAEDARLVDREGAGYRDAAVVMRAVSSDLEAVLARAAVEIRDDDQLRARIEAIAHPEVRAACLLAVEALARHLGRDRERLLFLDWLRSHWHMPPRAEGER